jgi:hypothetical protein
VQKVVVALLKGKRWWTTGLMIRIDEGEEELRTLVETVEEGIAKRFPNAQIVRRKAVRELFGE